MKNLIGDYDLVYVILRLKKVCFKLVYIIIRSFKYCSFVDFNSDVLLVLWFIVDVFDDVEDKFYVFDLLFNEIFDCYVLVKIFKVSGKLNLCVINNICGLIKIRDNWCKKVKKINDLLFWIVYRYFR